MLVTKPKALLLDEPLGDLDRLLQLRMRVELRNLQRQLGLMFIHVTHNQEEALSMADRIVVMNDARIQQIADPLTIATRPETEVVARFMGDNNIIRGRVAEQQGDRLVVVDDHGLRTSVVAPGATRGVGDDAVLAVRAAAVEVADGGAAQDNSAEAEIVFVEFLGDLVKLHLEVGGERMLAKVPGERYPLLRGREGERIRITWKEDDVQLLDSDPTGPLLDAEGSSRKPRRSSTTRRRRRSGEPEARGPRKTGWATFLWALPGGLWLGFFLVAPLVFIVLVSFWTYKLGASRASRRTGRSRTTTRSSTARRTGTTCSRASTPRSSPLSRVSSSASRSRTSSRSRSQTLRMQIALFIIALAPFWTSFLVRSVAWTYPFYEVLHRFSSRMSHSPPRCPCASR